MSGRVLVIKYTDGQFYRQNLTQFFTNKDAEMYVMMEGDHVLEWWIEKERDE